MAVPTILLSGVDHSGDMLEAFDVEATLGARTTLGITSKDLDSTATALRPTLDQAIVIRDGATALFSGTVLTVDDGPLVDADVGTRVRLSAVNLWRAAGARRVSEHYNGAPLAHIVQHLVDTYLTVFGITYGYTDPGPVLGDLVFDSVTVEDAFTRLSTLTGWVHRLRPDNVVEWFPIGTKARGITFSAANHNIIGPVTWQQTRGAYVNRQYVRYGTASQITKREDWTGDGVTAAWVLIYPAVLNEANEIISRGVVNEAGVDWPLGRYGIDTGYAYTYDPAPAPYGTIRRTAGPAAAAVAIWFAYAVQFPLTVKSEDLADIAARGPWEDVAEAPEIFDQAEAQALADSLRRKYSIVPRQVTFATRALPLFLPGDSVTLDLPTRTLPASAWLVTAVRMRVEVDQQVTSTLTLLEGTEAQASWIDYWKSLLGGAGGGSVNGTVSGGVIPPGPPAGGGTGDLTGLGTPGQLAAWSAPKILTDSGVLVSGGLLTNVAYTNRANTFVVAGAQTIRRTDAGPIAILDSTAVDGGYVVHARGGGEIMRSGSAKVTLSGTLPATDYAISSGGDIHLAAGNAVNVYSGRLSAPGNLTLAPAGGNLVLAPAGLSAVPDLNYHITLGGPTLKYLEVWGATARYDTLVAQEVISTIGGRIIVAPTTTLVAELLVAQISISVQHNEIAPGDVLRLEARQTTEFLFVNSGPLTIGPGHYQYGVTRAYGGGTAAAWIAGDAVINTGQSANADGYIDMFSTIGQSGPVIIGYRRIGPNPADVAERWAIGNLYGQFGYGQKVWGAAFGDPSATHLLIEATNGLRIRYGNQDRLRADVAGNLWLDGQLTIASTGSFRTGATSFTAGTGIWMDASGPRFRLGTAIPPGDVGAVPGHLSWDGDKLKLWANGYIEFGGTGAALHIRPATTFYCDVPIYGLNAGGAYLYPASVTAEAATYNTEFYLASHRAYGLFSNQGIYCVAAAWASQFNAGTGGYHFQADANMGITNDSANSIQITVNTNALLFLRPNTVHAGFDNWCTLGTAGFRFEFFYVVNAPIVGSDRREKVDVRACELGPAFLAALAPVSFARANGRRHYGLIAQDVLGALGGRPGLVSAEPDAPMGIAYDELIAPLIVGWQDHEARIRALEAHAPGHGHDR